LNDLLLFCTFNFHKISEKKTTITIKDGDLKRTKFNNSQDLLDFLLTSYADNTVLVRTSIEMLNPEELAAWQKHKQDGYEDFVDYKG
jgi:hypothetical protein